VPLHRGLRRARLHLGCALLRLPGSRRGDWVEPSRLRGLLRPVRRMQGGPRPRAV